MAPTTCLRIPFLPARGRSANVNAPPSWLPRRLSLKSSATNGDNSLPNPISTSPTSPPWLTVVDVNGLRRPPAPVSAPTIPGDRGPRWLPRPFTSADVMGADWKGLKVAYQGCAGAYSEAAAKKAYPNCEAVPCEHFDTAFQAVQNWVVDRAVLPLENSLGGSIHRNYDLLVQHSLHIVGEVRLEVHHCLLANPGVKIENLKSVMSHPQALAQCEHTLTGLGIEHREAVDDTAGAAKIVAEHMVQDTGAIASSLAAKLYGLDVLAENIQDGKNNVTRFMMLARKPNILRNDRPFKTSIVFSLEEGHGQLFRALGVFAQRKINLTKIESRPHKERPLRVSDDCSSLLKSDAKPVAF
ncbi:Arogenate dehydratase/prephenate dehydratase 2 chloroplastic [Zea mays]|uniref:arogenate dehydratase n=1 Tax=Zea mays TaxID=4577 RepID=A0A1D6PD03_MAIZE|nr:Arogenate dehydratase/prephenate dehydratase 2 chloroplastic [Zea mays]